MSRNRDLTKRTLSTAVAAASMLLCTQSYGQGMLEEIIVTAQKRTESVQEIPLTVAVVTGDTLEQFSINNASDLARSVPGLEIEPAPQGLHAPRIRGLGTGVGAENVEQSVGLFIDGIYSGKPRDLQSAMFDVGRVEVIKGTQTSQLGKNTSLGAILIYSNRPEDENGGYAQAEYDFELGSTIFTGAGNLATDFGNYRLAVSLVDEEGYVENQRVGGDDPAREEYSVRLSGQWDIGSKVELYASYTYDDREVTGMSFEVSEDSQGWYEGLTGDTDTRLNNERKTWTNLANDGKDFDEQESHRAVIELAYDISDSLDFISLTGYSEYDNTRRFDSDFSTLDYADSFRDSDFDQFSQEFRFNGAAFNGLMDYVAGFYYMENHFKNYQGDSFEQVAFLPLQSPLYAASGPSSGAINYEQDIETWSVYANGALNLGERWRLTVGLRYTDETKDLENWSTEWFEDESSFYLGIDPENGIFAPLPPAALPPGTPPTFFQAASPPFDSTDRSHDEDNVDGSINLQYAFSDAGNVYASWARGSKGGGYSTSAGPDSEPFDTEEAETTELGFKSELLGGGLRLNAALFYTEIDNFQSVVWTGTTFDSAAIPVESKGMEFESMWAATDSLTLALSATYADAENTDTDESLQGAPEWSAALSVDHSLALGSDFELRTNAQVNYRGDIYTQTGETYEAPAITLVDLRVALAPVNSQWELAVMARNLFDEQKFAFGFAMPLVGDFFGVDTGSYNRPRTVAIQARYNF